MKLLLIVCFCCPMALMAQLPGRADDSLRKVSDTMHFPNPFTFSVTKQTSLAGPVLYKKCTQWINGLADSLHDVRVTANPAAKKITATNVPATADISFTIVITVSGKNYNCRLQQYIFHTINGGRVAVEKAATVKDYKITTNVERVIIMRKYPLVFDALDSYIKK